MTTDEQEPFIVTPEYLAKLRRLAEEALKGGSIVADIYQSLSPKKLIALLDRIASSSEEIDEFNAGFKAFKDGTPDSEPYEFKHDVWQIGHWWAQEQGMKVRVKELSDALMGLYATQSTSGVAAHGLDYERAMAEARRLMAMAPMDKCWDPKEWIEEMFENIVKNRGYEGWTLNWTTDAHCWHDKKRIDLNIESDPLEMALIHEVAHIKAPPDGDGNYHSVAFYEHMEKLSQQFLGRGIGDHDKYRRELAEKRESKS